MATWAQRRQVEYFLGFMAVMLVVAGVPLFFAWYQKPTCFDAKQNGAETGVDCGGSCVKLCTAENLSLGVEWQQSFRVTPGVYSVVAYVHNPNIKAHAFNVPYTFRLYDSKNVLLAERTGRTYVPAGRNFAVFESNIGTASSTQPSRTTFEFTAVPDWRAAPTLPPVSVTNQILSGPTSTPVVEANIANDTFQDIGRVNVVAIVYDTAGNAVAASRTYLDRVPQRSSGTAVFTWPEPFAGQLGACEKPSDIMLAIDRSGSMALDKRDPPEPMTSVKNAALAFVGNLKTGDRVGLVSYATNASTPADKPLTASFGDVKDAIAAVAIRSEDGLQYTNIADALDKAAAEFSAGLARDEVKKTVILLTDGEATYPEKKGDPAYAATLAREAAAKVKASGIEVYTIGLGTKIDATLLSDIATSPKHYYRAPETADLVTVYSSIASAMCKQGPAKVEILPDIVPQYR